MYTLSMLIQSYVRLSTLCMNDEWKENTRRMSHLVFICVFER